MNRKTKIFITIIFGFALIIDSSALALAGTGFQSNGKFEYKFFSSSPEADVILDSEDITSIYTEVKDGKIALATKINDSLGTDTLSTDISSLPTFEELNEAVNDVKPAGIREGVDSAYNQIATSPNLDDDIYGNVTDITSLETALSEKDLDFIAKVRARPTDYGFDMPYKLIKVVDNRANGSANIKQILEDLGEDSSLYSTLTEENFYFRIGEDVSGSQEGDYSAVACTTYYDVANGILWFSTGHNAPWTDNSNNKPYYSWVIVDIYLIY